MVCPSLILLLFINGSVFVIVWRRASEVSSLRGPTWKRHGREFQGQYPPRWTHHDSTRSPPDSRKDKPEVEVILRWLLQENANMVRTIFNHHEPFHGTTLHLQSNGFTNQDCQAHLRVPSCRRMGTESVTLPSINW